MFDREGHIDTVNPGATRILRLPVSAWQGRRLPPSCPNWPTLRPWSSATSCPPPAPRPASATTGRRAFELGGGDGDRLTLLVRGARAARRARGWWSSTTSPRSSRRSAHAWAEVARRLAHEIKNPLTPIQLGRAACSKAGAQAGEGSDQAMLKRSVATIVNQVQAMKQLVNEFRDYARLPAAQMRRWT